MYSASETASREFPDLDVSLRGAVSIARRAQDPLAEHYLLTYTDFVTPDSLLLGTTACIYDGHPSHPSPDALWRVAERFGATFLGDAYYLPAAATGTLTVISGNCADFGPQPPSVPVTSKS